MEPYLMRDPGKDLHLAEGVLHAVPVLDNRQRRKMAQRPVGNVAIIPCHYFRPATSMPAFWLPIGTTPAKHRPVHLSVHDANVPARREGEHGGMDRGAGDKEKQSIFRTLELTTRTRC